MSRPSVVPRYAVTVGSLQGGTVIGKTPEERGKLHLGFYTQNFYTSGGRNTGADRKDGAILFKVLNEKYK